MRVAFGSTWLTGPTNSERARLVGGSAAGALQIEEAVRATHPTVSDRGNRTLELSLAVERHYATAEAAAVAALTLHGLLSTQVDTLDLLVGARQLHCASAALTRFTWGAWTGISSLHEFDITLLAALEEIDPPDPPDTEIMRLSVEIGNGVQDVTVSWDALEEIPDSVVCQVVKPAAAADDLWVLNTRAWAVDGCIARLSAPAPSTGYILCVQYTAQPVT